MAMGQSGTVINISVSMMNNALNAIEEYRSSSQTLHEELTGIVSGLIPSNFSGSAAEGFQYFYQNKIEPVIGAEGLTKLLDTLKTMMEEIRKAIPDMQGLDDQLADGNKGN